VWDTKSSWEGEEESMPTSRDATRPESGRDQCSTDAPRQSSYRWTQPMYFNQSNCLNITVKRNADLSVPDFSENDKKEIDNSSLPTPDKILGHH